MRVPVVAVAACILAAACNKSSAGGPQDAGHPKAGLDASTEIPEPDGNDVPGPDAQAVVPPDASVVAHPDAAARPDSGPAWPPGTFLAACDGDPTTLTGTAMAPNGTDPVDKALVEVWDTAPAPLSRSVTCDQCASSDALASVFSARDGTFSLSIDVLPEKASYVVTVRKAGFRRTISPASTPSCRSTSLGNVLLPGRYVDGDMPKMAVSSGNGDHLEHVLSQMGIIDYDCLRGLSPGSTEETCKGSYTLGDVLADPTRLNQYGMLFIACTVVGTYEPTSGTDPVAVNLRAWVENGGKLVVTDLSYDFVEQAFPDAIVFQGADAPDAGLPQPPDTAQLGDWGSCTSGTVSDPDLAAWLGNFPGAITGADQVPLEGFLSNWAVQKSVGAGTAAIVSGQATWSGGAGSGLVPLTSQFEVGGCGRVIFSSYHTSGSGTALLPQERILEYLMLEVGSCVEH